jgi:hypothetical protein
MRLGYLAFFAVALAGCTTDDTQRIDGINFGAGDAIAANTVMQMVDPWQDGVQHTNLKVPAERPAPTTVTDASAAGEADSGSED